MPWQCQVVHELGRSYAAAWAERGEDEHWHRHEEAITEQLYKAADRRECLPKQVVCDRCGQTFSGNPGFMSRPIWGTPDGKLQVGDMYKTEHGGKVQWWVVLPGGTHFDIHRLSSTDNKPWDVSGEPPNITMRPSIVIPKQWHGWITNGVLSDDLEGRKYD